MKKKSIKMNILGHIWTIKFGNPGPNRDALCDYETRVITLRRKSNGSLLNCLSHEIIHARCRDLDEEAVEDLGNLIDEAHVKVVMNLLV